jgi:hypothetical protein
MNQVDELIRRNCSNATEAGGEGQVIHKVLPTIQEYIGIFESNYSPSNEKDPDTELGGVLYLFVKALNESDPEYKELLSRYHIASPEYAEIDEVIVSDDVYDYRVQVYILSSDFGIVLIFPEIRNAEEGLDE